MTFYSNSLTVKEPGKYELYLMERGIGSRSTLVSGKPSFCDIAPMQKDSRLSRVYKTACEIVMNQLLNHNSAIEHTVNRNVRIQITAVKLLKIIILLQAVQTIIHPCVNGQQRIQSTSVLLWSSLSGWGLEVDRCNNTQQQDCYNPLVRYSLQLPPEDTPPHPSREGEGLTLTVLNQRNAAVVFHKVFPLGQYWAHYADLQWHMDRVASGRVVVITVSVSGTVGLRQAAHQLAQLGSLFALHLTPMAHWTWVFVKGGRTISETVILRGVAQHHAHLLLPLSDLPSPTQSSNQSLQQQRWQYCQLHGAMGGLCDEHSPDPLPSPSPPTLAHQSALANVPVVVTAGARHQYLYHTLNTLLAAPGAQRSNVLVVLGDAPQPTTQLLRLINVKFTQVPVHGKDNFKLFRYYRSVFQLVARTFPDAPAVIFLDEDVEVSPDFFSFMSQTLWLLREDPTLYCINGFSATGNEGRAFNKSQLFRGSVQVEWGYAVSLDFVREALESWGEAKTLLYDFWLYTSVRKHRECVFPEVSRTRHFGIGTNTISYFKESVIRMPLQIETPVTLPWVSMLKIQSWQQYISQEVKDATILTGNPCRDSFLPSPPTARTYVFYYRLDVSQAGNPDIEQYHHAVKCLGLWSLSVQGHHRGVSVVRFSPNSTLYLVGVPYSYYSHLFKKNIALWNVDSLSDQEFTEMRNYTLEQDSVKVHIRNINVTAEYLSDMLTTK
ncbi:protein O-linked-mannose beta-1,2-N-acetylglucosaminyltransferase 1-like [Penaeus japonicus]|uniref:protein O-linked-mannose beta-1,2-N-acetylglucosaminyltransferase 1-like n=1 Tax=Penaeus japonicus TaxID=27405 RepID=UPI001C70E0F4|nr:protein O-linked-mannose beta-1,2-N-acetylglucosaminyltransferase 1-like [Penaeus japonicus]